MSHFAIIPAAGRSKRMGQPKLLMPWNDSTLIEHLIDRWQSSQVTRVVVVARADDQPLAEIVRPLDVDLVSPDVPPAEMKISVSLALKHIEQTYSPTPTDGWLLAPADMPNLSPRVIDQLVDEHKCNADSILVAAKDGERGHPVLFPWRLAAEVHQLGANEGVNALVDRNHVRLVECSDDGILDDIDTPEDYQRLK